MAVEEWDGEREARVVGQKRKGLALRLKCDGGWGGASHSDFNVVYGHPVLYDLEYEAAFFGDVMEEIDNTSLSLLGHGGL